MERDRHSPMRPMGSPKRRSTIHHFDDVNSTQTFGFSQASTENMGNRREEGEELGRGSQTKVKPRIVATAVRSTSPIRNIFFKTKYNSGRRSPPRMRRPPPPRERRQEETSSMSASSSSSSSLVEQSRGSRKHNKDHLTKFQTHNKKSLATRHQYKSMVEAEIEESAIDVAIDSAILDLTGLYMDCSLLKTNPFVRKWIRDDEEKLRQVFPSLEQMKQRQENKDWKPATHGHYWNQVASATTTALAKMTGSKEHELSSAMALERETWMLSQLDIMDAKMKCKEPLKLTPELTSQIQRLPEKDVTLYIKLDEEIPANSCTVYQVDMQRFHQDRHRPDGVKRCDKVFRYFKICSKKNVLDRNDAIAGTLASACLYPYSMVPPTVDFGMDADDSDDLEFVSCTQKTEADDRSPFRPKLVYLDELSDIASPQLQVHLANMGIYNCKVVIPLLRKIHEASELDFFYPDDGFLSGLGTNSDDDAKNDTTTNGNGPRSPQGNKRQADLKNTLAKAIISNSTNNKGNMSPPTQGNREQEQRDNNSFVLIDSGDDDSLRDTTFEEEDEEYATHLVAVSDAHHKKNNQARRVGCGIAAADEAFSCLVTKVHDMNEWMVREQKKISGYRS